jgi:predicted HD superfamily hydrolase involved in NAD metabolism
VSWSRDAEELRIRQALQARLSAKRFGHSEAVAALARELCGRFGAPGRVGYLAGLAHDIARELPIAEIAALASRDGRPVSLDEEQMPILLHGRAGAVVLELELGMRAPLLLDAVRDHVTGRPGMGTISSIVYVADFLEPGRGFVAETERLRLLSGELCAMVRVVLQKTVEHLELCGRSVARVSRELGLWAEREEGVYDSQAASR